MRFTLISTCKSNSFLLIAVKWIYHSLFLYFPVDRWLDYFQLSTITNSFIRPCLKLYCAYESPVSVRLVLVTQSCPTFCNPMDYSPPGSSVHGISQVRILEWVAISSSGGSSRPIDGDCGRQLRGGWTCPGEFEALHSQREKGFWKAAKGENYRAELRGQDFGMPLGTGDGEALRNEEINQNLFGRGGVSGKWKEEIDQIEARSPAVWWGSWPLDRDVQGDAAF